MCTFIGGQVFRCKYYEHGPQTHLAHAMVEEFGRALSCEVELDDLPEGLRSETLALVEKLAEAIDVEFMR